MKNGILPFLSWLLIAVVYLASFIGYHNWKNGAILGGGDQMGYYIYEPSVFIYHDLGYFDSTIAKLNSYGVHQPTKKNPLGVEEFQLTPINRYAVKYTLGVAILQTPFFLVAHAYSLLTRSHADGFARVYIFFNCLSGIFYSLLGLWILIKVLKRYFSDGITSVVILAVGLATNLYFMQVAKGAMAHPYLFFLFTTLLYSTIRFYENRRIGWLAVVSLCCGMITLIRPDEGICLLLPILYGVLSISDLRARVMLFIKNPVLLAIGVGGVLIPLIPQLLYWKFVSGHFLYYSYGNEGFDFSHPHVIRGLTGWKNGWLSYTPVMIFAVAGMGGLYFRNRSFFYPVFLILCIHIVVIYSWWCWNYINGFGSRPMVDIYPLLALPMGYFFQWTFAWRFGKWLLAPVLLFFAVTNIFETYQNDRCILWTEDANRTFYFAAFGKTRLSKSNLVVYDTDESQPREENISFDHLLFYSDMQDSSYKGQWSDITRSGKHTYLLTREKQYGPTFTISAGGGHFRPGDWINISSWCLNPVWGCSFYTQSEMEADFIKAGAGHHLIKNKNMRIQNKIKNENGSIWSFIPNEWDSVSYFTRVPEKMTPDDSLKVFFWNPNGPPILIGDLRVAVYKEK